MRRVQTIEIYEKILNECSKRGDTWGLEVKGRLMSCDDLVAPEAVYHAKCHRAFCRVKYFDNCGRPINMMQAETFDRLCDWMEMSDFELLTLDDVSNKAKVLVPGNDCVYSHKWLKVKLQERYGDHIQFCSVHGRKDVICWSEMASYIVNQKWYENEKRDKSENIVITAAKLLKAAIRETVHTTNSYPTCDSVRDQVKAKEWLPSLVRTFMDNLICNDLKKIAIGHQIVQAVKPRSVIAPVPFAIGVSVDHVCGSKWLVNLLSCLGMSLSYDEVHRFKQSVSMSQSDDLPPSYPHSFTQFVADNIDHDVCTLDGLGTLHAMGIISVTNSNNKDSTIPAAADTPVPRLKVV